MSWLTRKRGTLRQVGKKFPTACRKLPPKIKLEHPLLHPKFQKTSTVKVYGHLIPVDENIASLVKYLNLRGAKTTNSCGHEGTVDVDDAGKTREAMKLLNLPKGTWRLVDYAKDSPLEGEKHLYVLQILGAKPNTVEMWNKVNKINSMIRRETN